MPQALRPGDRLTLSIEKPAAGGRMIARHQGAIVLVSGSIPGEIVEATIERVRRGTAWARTTRVIEPSPDRAEPTGDWTCGGNVFGHIRYERQLALKRAIIHDGFTRIGRTPAPDDLPVIASRADGYRMRARLHVRRGKLGFFREGTHELCPPAATGQLLPATIDALSRLEDALQHAGLSDVTEVELAENRAATDRAVHLECRPDADPARLGSMPAIAGITGVSVGKPLDLQPLVLSGSPFVSDTIAFTTVAGESQVALTRHAHSFFQGNRYLLADLLGAVIDAVPPGPVLDLYAGVGLFAVPLAVRGGGDVLAIEGDRRAADDLKQNAAAVGAGISVRHQSVETFLSAERPSNVRTVIVDPPRTGLSREALNGTLTLSALRLVYVSCDVATLARDARWLIDAGYRLTSIRAFDLFPNTAHVESLAVFDR